MPQALYQAWPRQETEPEATDNGYTRGQHALYMRVVLMGTSSTGTPQTIGLAQNVRWSLTTGNRPVNGIGEPGVENSPGMQYLTWSMEALTIRRRSFAKLIGKMYGITNVDLRTLALRLETDFSLKSGTGNTPFDASSDFLVAAYIQDMGVNVPDPNSLRQESLSGWAMGYMSVMGGVPVMTMGDFPSDFNPTGAYSTRSPLGGTTSQSPLAGNPPTNVGDPYLLQGH